MFGDFRRIQAKKVQPPEWTHGFQGHNAGFLFSFFSEWMGLGFYRHTSSFVVVEMISTNGVRISGRNTGRFG